MTKILITGASSGIGQGLALEYAAPEVYLLLCARNKDRLEEVAQACRNKGAHVETQVLDVMDRARMTDWIIKAEEDAPLDLVIANAGISSGNAPPDQWEETTRDIFAVNMAGVLNTVLPILPYMRERRSGQIAIVSSIAGFRGLGTVPAYSASKVCVKAYGEALRLRYGPDGVKINIICPGFVKSRITATNTFKMPFIMEPAKAAQIIRKGLKKNKAHIIFPWQMALSARLLSWTPFWVMELLSKILPTKE